MKLIFSSLFFLGFSLTGGLAQETAFNPLGRDIPIDNLEKQLRIQVEWIELTHAKYTELMAEKDPENPKIYKSGDDSALRQALTKMVKEGEARIIDTAMVLARSGQRAKVESIHEHIYPTEYDPPSAAIKKGEGEEISQLTNLLPNPTAFETRNLGTTLEVDPVLGADGVTIDLNLAPEIVYLVDHSEWGHFESDESVIDTKMPSFYTMKATTQVTMIAGQYCLIGVNSPHNAETSMPDNEQKVMIFVKSDLMVVGLPKDQEIEAPAGE